MAVRTKQELSSDLQTLVRSGGQGGKTTAQNLRDFLGNVIDTVFSGKDTARQRINFNFNSDIATSDEVWLKGKISSIEMDLSVGLSSLRFYAKQEGETAFFSFLDLPALQSWVDGNVSETTLWQLRIEGNFYPNAQGAAAALVSFNYV